jgi:hypothetical protein
MKFSIKDFKQFGKIAVATAFLLSISLLSTAKKQPSLVERVDPANWWVGMQYDTLELLISGANISKSTFTLTNSPSKILKQELSKNGNFIYLTLVIAPSQPAGNLLFSISNPLYKKPVPFNYPLLKRTGYSPKGIDASDNMYLLFPDRFANGDTTNDVNVKMNEKIVDRKALKLRHGGDLKGIQDHLDYLENLGVTALWINPVLENITAMRPPTPIELIDDLEAMNNSNNYLISAIRKELKWYGMLCITTGESIICCIKIYLTAIG